MTRSHRRRSVVLIAGLALIGTAVTSTIASAADGSAEQRSLTVTVLDPSGKPTTSYPLHLYSEKTGYVEDIEIDGSTTIEVPAGEYNVAGFIEELGVPFTMVHQPVDLTNADQELVLDTREAVRANVTVSDPEAETSGDLDTIGYTYDNGVVEYDDARALYSVSTKPHVLPVQQEGLSYFQMRGFVNWNDAAGELDASYTVVDYREGGGLPSDPTFEQKVADMAKVTRTYRGSNESAQTSWIAVGLSAPFHMYPSTLTSVLTPTTVDEYYTDHPDFRWTQEYSLGANVFGIPDDKPVEYHGTDNVEVWNRAVVGPSLFCGERTSIDDECEPDASRTGNRISWTGNRHLALPADTRDLNFGEQYVDGDVTIANDGEVIAERANLRRGLGVELPEDPGVITLTVDANRNWEALSRKIDVTYTFPATNTADGAPLPLIAVRYEPEGLDENNAAPAGETTTIPIWIEGYASDIETLEIEASTDDGETWEPLDVQPTDDGYEASFDNPDSGYVSLRAEATDIDGNTVEQTILRAYQIAE